ncbi:choline O-acetyltransferase-like [Babylonia areolata]|uniref:choline O-acetyltransferase-like n=1 Tax=Babylonia areolata TaxID=304850 RepID=UPI003FD610DD
MTVVYVVPSQYSKFNSTEHSTGTQPGRRTPQWERFKPSSPEGLQPAVRRFIRNHPDKQRYLRARRQKADHQLPVPAHNQWRHHSTTPDAVVPQMSPPVVSPTQQRRHQQPPDTPTHPVPLHHKNTFIKRKQPRREPNPFAQRAWGISRSSSTCSQHLGVKSTWNHDDTSVCARGVRPLPKLPVPEVKDTMNKYLTVLSTVISPHELHVTKQHVQQFMTPGGWGDKLQYYLLQRRSETDNWALDWWLDDMYLKPRNPLHVNVNTASFMTKKHFTNREQQLRHASKMIGAVLDYKSLIDSGTIPVDTLKDSRPLCMQQSYNIFSSYRRPGIPSDQLITSLGTQRPAFIVVACREQFYRVDVEQDGVTLSEGELFSQLCKVVSAADRHAAGSPPVGVLTAVDRSAWAEARERLIAEPGNLQNLEALENCLVVVCLDKPSRGSVSSRSSSGAPDGEGEHREVVSQAYYGIHGDGTAFNSCNRWFDKTVQEFVFGDCVDWKKQWR